MQVFSPARTVAAIGLLLACVTVCLGQDEVASQPKQISPALPAGTRSYSPGAWGLVELRLVNPAGQPARALTSLYFADDPNQQFGREVWLPPRSQRISWYPVLIPGRIPENAGRLEYKALFLDRTGGSEQFIPSRTGQMLSDGVLPLHTEQSTTCWISDGAEDDSQVGDMITAARISSHLTRRIVQLHSLVLPPSAESLQGLDLLVLSGDRPSSDAAGLLAIRNWVARGGRLWILLDQVDPTTVERLLGDSCRIETVDRIGLTEVEIKGTGPARFGSLEEPHEYETPVEMVRVLAEGVEVVQTVNGWPATFRQPLGHGEVWFTTLEARAWIRPRTAADPRPADGAQDVYWIAQKPLESIASQVMKPAATAPAPPELWEPLLSEQIGYEIIDRGSVAALLGGFCAVLIGGAVWLGRRRRLERMIWAAPLLAICSAGLLGAVGLQNTQAIPPTVAEGQLIETTPGSRDVQVSGLMMFYNQQTTAVPAGAERGGVFIPDMTGFADQTRRMVWTDWNRWQWENLRLPRGVRIAPFQQDARVESPILVNGAFDPEGLSGRVSGVPGQLSDLVLAVPPRGNLSVRPSADGRFVAGADDVLAPGKFLSETLLTDAQRRRQALYQRLLHKNGREGSYISETTLLGWSEPLETGFVLPEESRRIGSALLVMPLQLEQTAPGTDITLPAPFLPYRAVPAPDGTPASAPLNNRLGEWSESAGSSEFWLRFQLPGQVLPVDLRQADLTLRISGAATSLELLGLAGDRVEVLAAWENPVGTLRHSITRSEMLRLDGQGGLRLGLRVRGSDVPLDASDQSLRQYWRIESLDLQASGRTREAAPPSDSE